MSEPGERRRRRELERTGTHRALTPDDVGPGAVPAESAPPAPGSRRARRAELLNPPSTPVPVVETTAQRAHEHRATPPPEQPAAPRPALQPAAEQPAAPRSAAAQPAGAQPNPSSPATSGWAPTPARPSAATSSAPVTSTPVQPTPVQPTPVTRAVPRVTPGVPPVGPSARPARAVRTGDPSAVPRPVPAHPDASWTKPERATPTHTDVAGLPAPTVPGQPTAGDWGAATGGAVPTPSWWAQAVGSADDAATTPTPSRPRWAPEVPQTPAAAVPGPAAPAPEPAAPAPAAAATRSPLPPTLPPSVPPTPRAAFPAPPTPGTSMLDDDEDEPMVPAWAPTATAEQTVAPPTQDDDEDDEEPTGRSYTFLQLVVLALVAFVLGVLIWLLYDQSRDDSAAAEPVGYLVAQAAAPAVPGL